jgi:tripartite-type tricarboxylate transporter receptor subunit TctC
MKALAIADRNRSSLLPNVPTMTEAGFANFVLLESWGLVATPGTPPDAAHRLRAESVKILQTPATVERYAAQGITLAPTTPEELRKIMTAEIRKYQDIVKRSGARAN